MGKTDDPSQQKRKIREKHTKKQDRQKGYFTAKAAHEKGGRRLFRPSSAHPPRVALLRHRLDISENEHELAAANLIKPQEIGTASEANSPLTIDPKPQKITDVETQAPSNSEMPVPNMSEGVPVNDDRAKKMVKLLQRFIASEYYSHTSEGGGVYGAPGRYQQSVVESVRHDVEVDGVIYHVNPIITGSSGLVGEILVPADPQATQMILVNWVGTHSLESARADLESSPGADSFQKGENIILQQIKEAIDSVYRVSNKPVTLTINGHSLGGALAQLTMHACMRAFVRYGMTTDMAPDTIMKVIESEETFHRSAENGGSSATVTFDPEHVEKISLGTWNSAGVSKAVETSSNELAPIVHDLGVRIKASFGLVSGDFVQKTGEGTVLSNVSSNDAEVFLLKINSLGTNVKKLLLANSPLLIALGLLTIPAASALALSSVTALAVPLLVTAKSHTSKHFVQKSGDLPDEAMYRQIIIDPEAGLIADEKSAILGQLFENSPEQRHLLQRELSKKATILTSPVISVLRRSLHSALGYFTDTTNMQLYDPREAKLVDFNLASSSIPLPSVTLKPKP